VSLRTGWSFLSAAAGYLQCTQPCAAQAAQPPREQHQAQQHQQLLGSCQQAWFKLGYIFYMEPAWTSHSVQQPTGKWFLCVVLVLDTAGHSVGSSVNVCLAVPFQPIFHADFAESDRAQHLV